MILDYSRRGPAENFSAPSCVYVLYIYKERDKMNKSDKKNRNNILL